MSLGTFRKFIASTGGGIAVMTGVLMPMFLVLIGTLYETGTLLSQYSVSRALEKAVCERAVKPTRTDVPDDAVRRGNVLKMFDEMARQAGQTVNGREVSIDWLDVRISASFAHRTSFAEIFGLRTINYRIDYHCAGIPPFPKDADVVLDSNFVKPDGSDIPMKYGCWGIYKYNEIGWDAGTGPGTEIQDWRPGCFGTLPQTQYPSRYVLELDSDEAIDTNSSITKVMELHPGRYEFSVWYNGRNDDTASNIIGVYLQRRRPTLGSAEKLFTLSAKGSDGWILFKKTVIVQNYSVYNLTIQAEGTDDTFGGLIYAFNVVYMDTQ